MREHVFPIWILPVNWNQMNTPIYPPPSINNTLFTLTLHSVLQPPPNTLDSPPPVPGEVTSRYIWSLRTVSVASKTPRYLTHLNARCPVHREETKSREGCFSRQAEEQWFLLIGKRGWFFSALGFQYTCFCTTFLDHSWTTVWTVFSFWGKFTPFHAVIPPCALLTRPNPKLPNSCALLTPHQNNSSWSRNYQVCLTLS